VTHPWILVRIPVLHISALKVVSPTAFPLEENNSLMDSKNVRTIKPALNAQILQINFKMVVNVGD
jgi:hypothetical protein